MGTRVSSLSPLISVGAYLLVTVCDAPVETELAGAWLGAFCWGADGVAEAYGGACFGASSTFAFVGA